MAAILSRGGREERAAGVGGAVRAEGRRGWQGLQRLAPDNLFHGEFVRDKFEACCRQRQRRKMTRKAVS